MSVGFILASVLVIWASLIRVSSFEETQRALLVAEVKATARQVEQFLEHHHNFASAFVQDHPLTFTRMLKDPEDEDLLNEMRHRVTRYVPGLLEYTVAGPDEVYAPDPLGTLIGDQCLADIHKFEERAIHQEQAVKYNPYIHPQSGNYHFDMMVPWVNEEAGQQGVFFVSFPATQLQDLLKESQRDGHLMMISRTDLPRLIEATADGVRDTLERDFSLSDEEFNAIQFKQEIRDSRWVVYGSWTPQLMDSHHRHVMIVALIILTGLLLFYTLSIYVIVRLRRQEQLVLAQLETAKNVAEHASNVKSDFLSSMSHELRTPLNAVIGFCQVLRNHKAQPLSETQANWVTQIYNGGSHLLKLIDDLLQISRIEKGELDLHVETLAVSEILEDVVPMLEELAQERSVLITLKNPRQIMDAQVRVDRLRIRQVLLNLLSNAIKYNHEGGQVDIYCTPKGQGFRLSITDTGIGIPKEKHGQLFQAFQRLGAEHTPVEGTGIGLVVTKNLVEMMGGELGFESEEGKGSTFWVDLKGME